MGFVSFHPFYCLFYYFFCVWNWFHCTFRRGHCLGIGWFVEICAYFFRISSLSGMISPDSFLMLVIICLFMCLWICLGPFLASNVSCVNSFLFSLLLIDVSFSLICWVLHTLPCLLVFCLLSDATLSLSYLNFSFCILSTLLDCKLLCSLLYGVNRLSRFCWLVPRLSKRQIGLLILFRKGWLMFLTPQGLIWVVFVFGFCCRDCLHRIYWLDRSKLFQKTIDSSQCFPAHL